MAVYRSQFFLNGIFLFLFFFLPPTVIIATSHVLSAQNNSTNQHSSKNALPETSLQNCCLCNITGQRQWKSADCILKEREYTFFPPRSRGGVMGKKKTGHLGLLSLDGFGMNSWEWITKVKRKKKWVGKVCMQIRRREWCTSQPLMSRCRSETWGFDDSPRKRALQEKKHASRYYLSIYQYLQSSCILLLTFINQAPFF